MILTPPPKKKKAYTLACLLMSTSVNIFCLCARQRLPRRVATKQHNELWREVDLVNMADLSQLT